MSVARRCGPAVLLALVVLPMSACASTPDPAGTPAPATAAAADSLEGPAWRLATIGGRTVTPPYEAGRPVLTFDAATARVSGTTGANRLTGPYVREGAQGLRIPSAAATRRAPADETVAQLEQDFLGMLEAVRGWRIERGALALLDERGGVLATFTR